jgi:hypothetical protein
MRYIKNLINNISYLLKHDIKLVINDMMIDYNHRININGKKIDVCCERLGNIEHDLNHDEGITNKINDIKYDIKELNNYIDDKNLYLFNIIENIKDKKSVMSNKRVSNKGVK